MSKLSYLIDTGAEVSVLPPRSEDRDRSPVNNMQLQAANGTAIRTFGQRSVAVELGLAKSFEWSFTIADVSKPILGADFLRHYGLLVDLKCKRLMDAETFLTVPTSYRRSTVSKLCVLVKNDSYSDILNEFQEVTTPCIKKCRLLGKVEHHIDTRCCRPVFARARRLSLDKLAAAKDEFNKLLEMDVIQPSNSPWSSPLHMVEKPSGGWRACGDYRALNAASEDDRYPMPHLQDFTIHLEGKSIFSKVDLVRAYNQVPMNASDIAKTAIVTPFGLFEYKRMPFGLKNAAQTFQRLMDNVLRDCSFAYVYLDDILVASSSVDEHRQHLRQLFRKLADYGVVVNPQKCVFGQSSLEFLGHYVTSSGVQPLQSRVESITDFPRPRSSKSLQEYLGMLNFYRRFVPHAASMLLPLYELVNVKGDEFEAAWTTRHGEHFQRNKVALATATYLAHPSATAETCINTDASDTAVGAVLQQRLNGVWTPISFFSRKLHAAETKYSTFDKELLAMYLAVKKFRYFIEGRQVTLFTDHRPLTFVYKNISDKWSPRQQRHLCFISEFTTDLRYVPGADNVVADALSRAPVDESRHIANMESVFTGVIDYVDMAKQQAIDIGVQRLIADANSSLKIVRCKLPDTHEQLIVDMSTGKPRPLLPGAWTRKIFDINHELAHVGARAMRRMICDRFVWSGMARDIRLWARTCVACQRAKVSQPIVAPLMPLPMPAKRFDSLHVDLVGPLPESQGFTYLLTIVDRFTRWPEAIPLSDISAATCARAFLYHWVSRHGVPSTLTSDRGRQFVSALWTKTASLLGTSTNTTTSYHPQANGLVERMHRTMKSALKAKLATDPNWVDALPLVLLGMRAAVKNDLHCSVAEMVFGEPLRLPGEFFVSSDGDMAADPAFVADLRQKIRLLRPIPPVWHGGESRRSYVSQELSSATHVFVRVGARKTPLQSSYQGPFKVLERREKYFKLDLGNRHDMVSLDRIKPAFMDATDTIEPVPLVTSSGRLVRLPARYRV